MSPDYDAATTDELDQLTTRIDARFQAVNARFIGVDGRFAKLSDLIGDIDQELQMLERRSGARGKHIDDRIDAARTQLDHLGTMVNAQIGQLRRDITRIVLLGLLVTIAGTAALCVATIILFA